MQLGVVTSALVVCLYGWRQDVPGVLRVLGNVVGTGVYFRADLVEAIVPQAVSNAPIVLLGQVLTAVGADYGLKLTYTLPIDYSNNIYIQLDDLFPTNPLHTYSTCTLNTTNISCTAIAANLILLTTTYSHIANTVYQLYAYPLSPTDHPVPDSELISFKMFITDNLITGSTVLYGSH